MHRRTFLHIAGLAGLGVFTPGMAEGRTSDADSPRYGMLVDLKKCVGCQSCAVSCAMENAAPPGAFRTSVGEYVLTPAGAGHSSLAPLPRLCNHCENPACLPVCPVRATYQRADGIVVIDATKCIGCGFCVQACPYGARFLNHVTHTADKCTFCAHRLAAGLLPACVESCVGGARMFGDLNAPDSLIRRTLDEHRDDIAVLYPEKGTSPRVFYRHLDAVLEHAAAIAAPMPSIGAPGLLAGLTASPAAGGGHHA